MAPTGARGYLRGMTRAEQNAALSGTGAALAGGASLYYGHNGPMGVVLLALAVASGVLYLVLRIRRFNAQGS